MIEFEHHPFRQYAKSGEHKGRPMAQIVEDSQDADVTVVIFVKGRQVRLDVLDRTLETYTGDELIIEEYAFGPSTSMAPFEEAFKKFKEVRKKYRKRGGVVLMNVTGVKIKYLRGPFSMWGVIENAKPRKEKK